jgi:hypothetical protein
MLARKIRVYLMRKGDRHYECVGERAVSVSDDRRDAWFDVDGAEVHAVITRDRAFAEHLPLRPDIVRDIYLHEQ